MGVVLSSILDLYMIHVVRVGGDFMTRFALPWAIPLLMLLGTWIQEQVTDTSKRMVVLFLVTAVSITSIAPNGLTKIDNGVFGINGITEESHWYTEEWRAKAELANEIKPLLKDTPVRVIYGAQAMFAYYAELPYLGGHDWTHRCRVGAFAQSRQSGGTRS